MILLTHLNGSQMYLNADLVATVEPQDDTVVTLVDGRSYAVRESASGVVESITSYRALVLAHVEMQLGRDADTMPLDERAGGRLLHLHPVPDRGC